MQNKRSKYIFNALTSWIRCGLALALLFTASVQSADAAAPTVELQTVFNGQAWGLNWSGFKKDKIGEENFLAMWHPDEGKQPVYFVPDRRTGRYSVYTIIESIPHALSVSDETIQSWYGLDGPDRYVAIWAPNLTQTTFELAPDGKGGHLLHTVINGERYELNWTGHGDDPYGRKIAVWNPKTQRQSVSIKSKDGCFRADKQDAIQPETVYGLTILIDFPDRKPIIPAWEVYSFLNQPGYDGYQNVGSIRDYYLDVSANKFDFRNTVCGYYTAPQPVADYRGPDKSKKEALIKEAIRFYEQAGLDLSGLSQKDGQARALNVYFAGDGVAEGVQTAFKDAEVIGGIRFNRHTRMELVRPFIGLLLFAHENGHLLFGWPDLYKGGSNLNYGLMGGGAGGSPRKNADGSPNYAGNKNPLPPEPHLRLKEGWAVAEDVMPGERTARLATNSFSKVYRMKNPNDAKSYFLFESIIQRYRYKYALGNGLLTWKIDERESGNCGPGWGQAWPLGAQWNDVTSSKAYKPENRNIVWPSFSSLCGPDGCKAPQFVRAQRNGRETELNLTGRLSDKLANASTSRIAVWNNNIGRSPVLWVPAATPGEGYLRMKTNVGCKEYELGAGGPNGDWAVWHSDNLGTRPLRLEKGYLEQSGASGLFLGVSNDPMFSILGSRKGAAWTTKSSATQVTVSP